MKRSLIILISVMLLISSGPFVYGNQEEKFSSTFQEKPPTEGLRGETANTLTKGEIKVGDLSIPFRISQLKWIRVEYGITNNFQVGTALPANFLGDINVSAKYHFLHLPRMDLAIPSTLFFHFAPLYISVSLGMATSWGLTDGLDLHTGARIWGSSQGEFKLSSLYAIGDLDIFPNMKLLSELNLYPSLDNPLRVRIGGLMRLLDFLNVKVTGSVSIPSTNNYIDADIFFRFRGGT